jgi:hypothetical protein
VLQNDASQFTSIFLKNNAEIKSLVIRDIIRLGARGQVTQKEPDNLTWSVVIYSG